MPLHLNGQVVGKALEILKARQMVSHILMEWHLACQRVPDLPITIRDKWMSISDNRYCGP